MNCPARPDLPRAGHVGGRASQVAPAQPHLKHRRKPPRDPCQTTYVRDSRLRITRPTCRENLFMRNPPIERETAVVMRDCSNACRGRVSRPPIMMPVIEMRASRRNVTASGGRTLNPRSPPRTRGTPPRSPPSVRSGRSCVSHICRWGRAGAVRRPGQPFRLRVPSHRGRPGWRNRVPGAPRSGLGRRLPLGRSAETRHAGQCLAVPFVAAALAAGCAGDRQLGRDRVRHGQSAVVDPPSTCGRRFRTGGTRDPDRPPRADPPPGAGARQGHRAVAQSGADRDRDLEAARARGAVRAERD